MHSSQGQDLRSGEYAWILPPACYSNADLRNLTMSIIVITVGKRCNEMFSVTICGIILAAAIISVEFSSSLYPWPCLVLCLHSNDDWWDPPRALSTVPRGRSFFICRASWIKWPLVLPPSRCKSSSSPTPSKPHLWQPLLAEVDVAQRLPPIDTAANRVACCARFYPDTEACVPISRARSKVSNPPLFSIWRAEHWGLVVCLACRPLLRGTVQQPACRDAGSRQRLLSNLAHVWTLASSYHTHHHRPLPHTGTDKRGWRFGKIPLPSLNRPSSWWSRRFLCGFLVDQVPWLRESLIVSCN